MIRSTQAPRGTRAPASTARQSAKPNRLTPPIQADAGERLSKRVMQIKACSRTEAEQFIEGGWVQVNGVVVETPQFRVQQQTVVVDPAATLLSTESITLVLNKPPGWLDGVSIAGGPKTKNSRSLLTLAQHFPHDESGIRPLLRHFNKLDALVPLETGASGLLVFTQDWRTTRKLTEDMGAMEHEMLVDVAGEVPPEALQKIARALNDERNPLPHTKFSVNSSSPERSKLRFAIKGAHPGLAAYLCGRANLEVLAMRRIRVGRVLLRDLPEGQWRYLAPLEKF
jgi:23S rRNA pseudouridine2604 synthase